MLSAVSNDGHFETCEVPVVRVGSGTTGNNFTLIIATRPNKHLDVIITTPLNFLMKLE